MREWFQAAHPEGAIILSLRLRPFTLGHEILLNAAGLIQDERCLPGPWSQRLEHLLLACLICSQEYAPARALLCSRIRPISPIGLFLRLWRWRLRWSHPDLRTETAAFLDYRARSSWWPEENRDLSGRARSLGSPWTFRLLAWLMHEFHWPESHALDCPLGRANALYCAWQEYQDKMSIYGESEEALFSHLETLEAQEAKGENVWD